MSAQIIEFPMNRVRPAVASTRVAPGVRQSRSLPQNDIRPSVRIARSIVGWSLVAVTVYWLLSGQGSVVQSAEANTAGSSLSQTTKFEYVTVMSGQSLWSIAEQYAPDQDPRDFIQQVISLNNLSDSVVSAGMRLALPKN